jgi:hypothetical protein
MKTFFFLSTALTSLGAVAAICLAAPSQAQGDQRLPASGYCTGEAVQISGWETDLVRRNKGLEKFHWSAINTVQHYNVVATPTTQKSSNKQPNSTSTYHNIKPNTISTWASLKAPIADRTCIATADNGNHAGVSGRMRNTNSYGQLARGYEGNYSNQQAQYGGERSTDNQVSGRVMHY